MNDQPAIVACPRATAAGRACLRLIWRKPVLRPGGAAAARGHGLRSTGGMPWPLLHLLFAAAVLLLAAWLRPWRALGAGDPPWPWVVLWLALPWLWTLDHRAGLPLLLPWSGASLLVLMAGWPLAVLAMGLAAGALTLLLGLPAAEALQRLVWLGLVPGSLALGLGAALRRWLPRHLFIYILGRGFLGTLQAAALAGWLAQALLPAPPGSRPGDLMVGQWLAAFGEAFLSGMFCAIGVAFRPHWLATYADRLYLPPRPRP
jgi:uncharacterized membrane protein